jgi:hypothetical protein
MKSLIAALSLTTLLFVSCGSDSDGNSNRGLAGSAQQAQYSTVTVVVPTNNASMQDIDITYTDRYSFQTVTALLDPNVPNSVFNHIRSLPMGSHNLQVGILNRDFYGNPIPEFTFDPFTGQQVQQVVVYPPQVQMMFNITGGLFDLGNLGINGTEVIYFNDIFGVPYVR